MISKSDLKTNEAIQTFIEDVKNKSQKIQELIAEKEQALSQPSRSFPIRMGGGITQLPTQPAFSLFPPQSPLQPQIIPSTPIPSQKTTTPSQTTPIGTQATTTQTDPTLEALQKIAQETQTELEKSGVDVPEAPKSARNPLFENEDTDLSRTQSGSLLPDADTPVARPPTIVPPLDISKVQPTSPLIPTPQEEQPQKMLDSDLEEFSVKEYQTTQSPPDLYPLYRRLRFYIENVEETTKQGKTVEGVYHIPLEKYNGFIAAKTELIKDYQKWFSNLNNNQRIYMANQPIMSEINKLMLKYTRIEPKELAKEEFKLNDIPFTEITQGNEKPELETAIQERGFSDDEKQKIKIEYNKLLAAASQQITTIETDLNKTDNTEEDLTKIIKDIDELEDNITQTHDKLDPAIKVGVITLYEKTKVRLSKVLRTANQKLDFVVKSPGAESSPPKSPISIKPPPGPPPAPKQPKKGPLSPGQFNDTLKIQLQAVNNLAKQDTSNSTVKDLQNILKQIKERENNLKNSYSKVDENNRNIIQPNYDKFFDKTNELTLKIDRIISNQPLPNDLPTLKRYVTTDEKFGTKGPGSIGSALLRLFGAKEETRINNIKGPTAKTDRKEEVRKLVEKYEQGPERVEVAAPPT